MKYIINNNRLQKLMYDYLNDRMNDFHYSKLNTFILIQKKNENYPEDVDDSIIMEYDSFDNRLYINNFFLSTFYKWFPLSPEESKEFIKYWFEDRYNVEIKKVDS